LTVVRDEQARTARRAGRLAHALAVSADTPRTAGPLACVDLKLIASRR
jgi:hypothetical protein